MRRLASLVLALALLPAALPASADPPLSTRVENALEGMDSAAYALCSVDLCLPPWYVDVWMYCPTFASLAPGIPGVVDIGWDGDTSIAGRRMVDCPPYDGGGFGMDLSDTYAATVQPVVDLLNAACDAGACLPPSVACEVFALSDCPPDDPPVSIDDTVAQAFTTLAGTLEALCDAGVCTSRGPVLCPVFAKLYPSDVPGVGIGPDGDVEINGRLVYTCPPYDS